MRCTHCGNEESNRYISGGKHQRLAICSKCGQEFTGAFFTDDWTFAQWRIHFARDHARNIYVRLERQGESDFMTYVAIGLMSDDTVIAYVTKHDPSAFEWIEANAREKSGSGETTGLPAGITTEPFSAQAVQQIERQTERRITITFKRDLDQEVRYLWKVIDQINTAAHDARRGGPGTANLQDYVFQKTLEAMRVVPYPGEPDEDEPAGE